MMTIPGWNELKLKSSLRINILVLKFGGCWWPETENTFLKNLYTCYSIIFVLNTLVIYTISEFIYAFRIADDIKELTSCCFLLSTHVMQMIKVYTFIKYQAKIKDFLKDMENELFRPRYQEQEEMMRISAKTIMIVYGTFQFMGLATCVLWASMPFLERKENENIMLPLKGWYPFDTDEYLQEMLILQILVVTVSAVQNINIASTVASCMRFFCDQFDLLNDSLEHIRKRCEYYQNYNVETNMDIELERCIHHHLLILKMIKKFIDLFNLIVFGEVGVTVLTMCMSMFKLTSDKIGGARFVSMITYQATILIQAFLYCWYGNEIMLKSSDIPLSAYKSNWMDCSEKFKKNLLFIMIRTKIPIKLYAAGLITLSIENFTSILQTSYSCLAVLQSVQDKEAT